MPYKGTYIVLWKLRDLRCILGYSQKEDDTSVGHGIRQSQNPTAHDGIAEVEDRHSKWRLSFKLAETTDSDNKREIAGGGGNNHRPITNNLVKIGCLLIWAWFLHSHL